MFRSDFMAYAMPTLALPDDFLPRTTQLLLPRLSTPDEREAWLAQAFFLNDPRLYHDLRQMTGAAPIVYVTRCITALLTAKCIPGRDVHSLALLLNAVRIASAPAEQREIDSLVTLLDPMCGPDAAPQPDIPITETSTNPTVKPANPLQSIDTPEDQRTPTVFISYSHRDDEFAHKLIADLQNAGHAIWIDTVSIKGGDAWVRSIADGIRNSYAFVTLISPDANGSRWVLREYLLADSLHKPIYPVLARQAEIPLQMIDRQAIEMHLDYGDGLRELLESLPAPSIPLPTLEAVAELLSEVPGASRSSTGPMPRPAPAPAAPPAPQVPARTVDPSGDAVEREQRPTAPGPVLQPASKGDGGLSLPDLSGVFDALKDAVLGRHREREDTTPSDTDDAKKREEPRQQEPPRRNQPDKSADQEMPAAEAPAMREGDESDGESGFGEFTEAEPQTVHPPSRRALELQYIQRQWAEAFSAQQDAPESDDDMIVHWMPLPDADLDAARVGGQSGRVDGVGAELMTMRRAVVMGDSPREASEAVWSAANSLMTGALSDPAKPLPIIVDLAKWTDEDQLFSAFLLSQLGDLSDYWHGLVDQRRAALLFSGFEGLTAMRKDVVETFLRTHPELPVLVAIAGESRDEWS